MKTTGGQTQPGARKVVIVVEDEPSIVPGMSGFELYDRLKKDPRTSRIPVLFETASAAEDISEFRRRGIATYVKKPFDLNVIVGYVKRLATAPSAGSPPGSVRPRPA